MPTKLRKVKARRPQFDRAIVELFRKLEGGPTAGKSYSAGEKALMKALGLMAEFYGGVTVTGDTDPPRPWLAAHAYWLKCRQIRWQLLEAVEELKMEEERAATGSTAQSSQQAH